MAAVRGGSVILAELAEAATRVLDRVTSAEAARGDSVRRGDGSSGSAGDGRSDHDGNGGPSGDGSSGTAGASNGGRGGRASARTNEKRGSSGRGTRSAGSSAHASDNPDANAKRPRKNTADGSVGDGADDDEVQETDAQDVLDAHDRANVRLAALRASWGDDLYIATEAKVRALRKVRSVPHGTAAGRNDVSRAKLHTFLHVHGLAKESDLALWTKEEWNVRAPRAPRGALCGRLCARDGNLRLLPHASNARANACALPGALTSLPVLSRCVACLLRPSLARS